MDGACTGPEEGPVRAGNGVFCLYGSKRWTGTSRQREWGEQGARTIARNSAFSGSEPEGRGGPAGDDGVCLSAS